MSDLFIVGLTGSTGAGKSEVAKIMEKRLSWIVIDADKLSRCVVEVGRPTLAQLVERFSSDILNRDGTLNRKRLAEKAFATPQETAALNAIVHPAVLQEIHRELQQAAENGKTVALIDAPLLLQTGLDAICHYTVAVVSTPEIRKARIMERDGLTNAEAEHRMSTQPSDDYYASRVTTVLYNLGKCEDLQQAATMLCEKIEESAT